METFPQTPGLVQLGKINETDGTLIFLHGLGDSSSGSWFSKLQKLRRTNPQIRVVFPTAPNRPITLNGGIIMTAWHDVENLEYINQGSFKYLELSKEMIFELIKYEEENGRITEKIILAGFSQGGALSLYAGLQYPRKLGGLFCMSSYLPLCLTEAQNFAELIEENKGIPVVMAHGDNDNIVKYEIGRKSADLLQSAGIQVDFHTYKGMKHTSCEKEVKLFYTFLKQNIGPSPLLEKAKEAERQHQLVSTSNTK